MIRRAFDRMFGVDSWFFFRMNMNSKLLRLRCVLLGGHRHVWITLRGGGAGQDALMCNRCYCHIAAYRVSIPPTTPATQTQGE